MEDEQELVCANYRMMPFSMTLNDLEELAKL